MSSNVVDLSSSPSDLSSNPVELPSSNTEVSSSPTELSSSSCVSSGATELPSTPVDETFHYNKENIDYSQYALDFFDDEVSHYDIIKSYTNHSEIILFHCFNGSVCSSANYNSNGTVSEFMRDEAVTKNYGSIAEWMNDYLSKEAPFDYILDHVFIGEDLVPLWKILAVVKEEYDNITSTDINRKVISTIGPHIILLSIVFSLMILMLSIIVVSLI
jgi:hypothetical protein